MNEDKINLISDFLNNKLSESQKDDFLKHLQTDSSLNEDFEKIGLLKRIAERNRVIENAKEIHQNQMESLRNQKGKIISFPKIVGFAAAASLIFMIYLGNADFEYMSLSSIERGDSSKGTPSPLNDLALGINFIKNNNPQFALNSLERAKNNQELTKYYQDAAQWYSVVALAQMDKDEEGKTLLNQIENSAEFKYKISWIEKMKMKVRLWF